MVTHVAAQKQHFILSKATLGTCPVLGAVLDARDTGVNTTNEKSFPPGLNIPLTGSEKQRQLK